MLIADKMDSNSEGFVVVQNSVGASVITLTFKWSGGLNKFAY